MKILYHRMFVRYTMLAGEPSDQVRAAELREIESLWNIYQKI